MFNKQTETGLFNSPVLYQIMRSQTHCIIAGASGSGKSVALHGLIYSVLLSGRNQFACIDLKRVELADYRYKYGSLGYADTAEKAVYLLNKIITTMNKRYKKMSRHGQHKSQDKQIYLFIDEFAELALSDQRKTIFKQIQSICQLGRAAGIHVILCSQCILAKVIPTEIKINFDCVLCLRVRTARDSRYIIGSAGAETFRQYGQGLLYYPELMQPQLVNVPMIAETERIRLLKMR